MHAFGIYDRKTILKNIYSELAPKILGVIQKQNKISILDLLIKGTEKEFISL